MTAPWSRDPRRQTCDPSGFFVLQDEDKRGEWSDQQREKKPVEAPTAVQLGEPGVEKRDSKPERSVIAGWRVGDVRWSALEQDSAERH